MQPTAVTPTCPLPSARTLWIEATAAGAVLMTVFDAVLLQQKKAFFTGGFLTAVHTQSVGQMGAFLAASLLSDASVIGALAAVALWGTARVRLSAPARRLLAALFGVIPLLAADFFSYRLGAYLGDAFDLSLMFDLTGRSPREVLAVSSVHLIAPLLLVSAGGAAAGALVWIVNRRAAGRRAGLPPTRQLVYVAAVWLMAGIGATAGAAASSEVMNDGLGRKPSGRAVAWVVDLVTDLDRDGFGLAGELRDPAPLDPAVYPYAPEVAGNGRDENGVGGDLPALEAYREVSTTGPWRQRPTVVLVVLESFRADAVGRTVNGRPVTPVLDALARRGAAATGFSHNGYTAQSRFHLFSGSIAGVREGGTLIDDFKANGYEVAYFSAQDDSFGGTEYSVGFDRSDVAYDARQDRARRYSSFATAGSLAVPWPVVNERLAQFLSKRDPARPLFLYLNYHETHYPYTRRGLEPLVSGQVLGESQIRPSRGTELREMYYNTASNVDAAIGQALTLLRTHLDDDPAVIVTADHGESLFDEGFLGHGYALNDAQTRIPLIAAGLPLEIRVPFGQADLRDAIGSALASTAAGGPRVVEDPSHHVFQYLGKIDRPRQIAFAAANTRTVYDFRTQKVRVRGGPWQSPPAVGSADGAAIRALVHTWERMIVARRARGGAQ